MTFLPPSWRSLSLSKRSLNHPKKVTLNHLEVVVSKVLFSMFFADSWGNDSIRSTFLYDFWKGPIPFYPTGSMYVIFTYIWLIFMVNVGKYSIHASLGYDSKSKGTIRSCLGTKRCRHGRHVGHQVYQMIFSNFGSPKVVSGMLFVISPM